MSDVKAGQPGIILKAKCIYYTLPFLLEKQSRDTPRRAGRGLPALDGFGVPISAPENESWQAEDAKLRLSALTTHCSAFALPAVRLLPLPAVPVYVTYRSGFMYIYLLVDRDTTVSKCRNLIPGFFRLQALRRSPRRAPDVDALRQLIRGYLLTRFSLFAII